MDTTHTILRSARSSFVGTMLSRISGLGRDMAMAFCFGSSPEIAAFMVAYRLANLFRRVLGEGNLQAGFVPHFEAARAEGRGEQFYRNIACSLALVLVGAVVGLELVLWASWHLAPSWREIIELSMWMVPGLFFICLYALNSSYLQCQKKYFVPAAAPIAFNVVWIFTLLLVWHLPRAEAVKWLSIAITLAFAGQWLATRTKIPWVRPELFSAEWKALLKPLSLGVVGIGAVQFNSALDAIFARLSDLKGPAFLWYAIRLEQLPLALFGIALSGALLPPLSRAFGQGEKYRELLQHALRVSSALMLLCTFGIFCLGRAGINLLYGHGDFSASDVEGTLHCLWGYGIGLIPSVFVLLLTAGFYAKKSYHVPTVSSLASVGLNICLNSLFVFGFRWGAVSVAIATSASALLNVLLLQRGLGAGFIFDSGFWRFFAQMTLCCLAPALVTVGIEQIGFHPTRLPLEQLFQFGCLTAVYLGGVGFFCWKCKMKELFELFHLRNSL